MEDYLSEKEQWEEIKAWVRENGLWIVAGVAVGAAALGGWRWYQSHVDDLGVQAGTQYGQMMEAFDRGDRAKALLLLGDLERDYSNSPYVDQARLAAAKSYVESGELDKASQELQTVVGHTKDSDLALIARLRLARVQISLNKPDDALATVKDMQSGAFASRYHEVRGDALYAKGDKSDALKEYLLAKTADIGGTGAGDQLDLKIADLSAGTARVATEKAPQPAAK